MTAFAHPVVAWAGNRDADTPLVVLLHGRGSNEHDIIALADHLPDRFAVLHGCACAVVAAASLSVGRRG